MEGSGGEGEGRGSERGEGEGRGWEGREGKGSEGKGVQQDQAARETSLTFRTGLLPVWHCPGVEALEMCSLSTDNQWISESGVRVPGQSQFHRLGVHT